MSLTLEIRGKRTEAWQINNVIASQIGRISADDTRSDAELIFGGGGDGPGIQRVVDRTSILQSINKLMPVTKNLPSGFQLHSPAYGKHQEQIGGSGMGAFINGKGYLIRCRDDFWQIRSYEEFREMTKSGEYKEVTKHYEPADIVTDDRGIIKIEPRKRGGRDLAWLLRQIKKFLESDPSEKVTIIWG